MLMSFPAASCMLSFYRNKLRLYDWCMQERFVVNIRNYKSDDLKVTTRIAEGRPAAVKLAERIGKFEEGTVEKIRAFLEGGEVQDVGITWYTDDGNRATILKVDE